MSVDLRARNAFARVPFPEFFGVDPMIFLAGINPAATEQVEPSVLGSMLHDRGARYALDSFNSDAGSVVMSGAEFSIVPIRPETLAERASASNTQTMRARERDQDERNATAARAGAHTLEPKVAKMHNLMRGYSPVITDLRFLKREIPKHWMAHGNEATMRQAAHTARDGLHGVLQVIADSRSWSATDLANAKLALEYRLMGGERTQFNFDAKKGFWLDSVVMLGNYVRDKRIVVINRLKRSEAIIDKHLGAKVSVA